MHQSRDTNQSTPGQQNCLCACKVCCSFVHTLSFEGCHSASKKHRRSCNSSFNSNLKTFFVSQTNFRQWRTCTNHVNQNGRSTFSLGSNSYVVLLLFFCCVEPNPIYCIQTKNSRMLLVPHGSGSATTTSMNWALHTFMSLLLLNLYKSAIMAFQREIWSFSFCTIRRK